VQSPEGFYWKVRYRNLANPAIALWEHERARKALLEQGRAERNEEVLFAAIEAQRLLVEDAAAKTKSARRQHQRSQQVAHLTPPAMPSRIIEVQQPTASDASSVQPYQIEDWT
jgi:putative transposase